MKALYKYPQTAFPYEELLRENQRRSRLEREYELLDTGAFNESRYFDVEVEYAKAGPNDTLIRVNITNRGPERAKLHLLPTLWFRNTWTWQCTHEGCSPKPRIWLEDGELRTHHAFFEPFRFAVSTDCKNTYEYLFTDNHTNSPKLFGNQDEPGPFKDAFHDYIVEGDRTAVSSSSAGTKVAPHFVLDLKAAETSFD